LTRPRIVFVVNEDWFFLSHRLVLARAARAAGATVAVVAGDTGKGDAIRGEGLQFTPLPISRKGTRPWEEVRTLAFLLRLYQRLRPDLIHHVTPKPVLYGSLAARALRNTGVVNAISGLGYAFTPDRRARLLRPIVTRLYRVALAHPRSRTIFQNHDTYRQFVDSGLIRRERAVLIRGSGVDCAVFRPTPEPTGRPIVMLAARMLWDKGIGEFVEAARLVRQTDPGTRFVLVGGPDSGNPLSVPQAQLDAWASEGVVEWWGHRQDMPQVIARAIVVVLPTYHEGLPKALLEAAASGRAIVATNVPGCREIVRDQVNGLLVPARDAAALARAIETLVASPTLRARFGQAGRAIAVAEFSDRLVVRETLALYRELLGGGWPPPPAPD
jgi:glycosyltransferase involved in cell wall biosynthesis